MRDPLGAFVPGTDVQIEGASDGPLAGLTFAAKDIFDVAGEVTGCGNPDWARTHQPAKTHAPLVRKLLDAGARLIGKTITDELAYSLNGQNFHYGSPTNSNAPGRITGGSSSGSASAVAGGVCDTALGSDTGGSIRIPASYCGLYGLRPTHGRLTLEGVMPLAPSFDTPGWFTRDTATFRSVADVLFEAAPVEEWRPSRLIVLSDAFALAEEEVQAQLLPLAERAAGWCGTREELRVGEGARGLEEWMLAFRHVQAGEIRDNHAAWIAQTNPSFGPEIQERFDWVAGIPAQEIETAKAFRERCRERLASIMGGETLLCLPTAPGIAPLLDATAESLRNHRGRVLSLTSIAGLAGLPQISLPLATVQGCPVGLSFIAPKNRDLELISFATRFAESLTQEPGLTAPLR